MYAALDEIRSHTGLSSVDCYLQCFINAFSRAAGGTTGTGGD